MRQRVAKFIKSHRSEISVALGILAIYAVMFAFGITCPIKYLTGVSCPGCGMSRACLNALKLDFAVAFSYHPLWIMLPFAIFFLLLFHFKKCSLGFRITLGVCIASMVIVYVIRFFSDNTVVVFAVEDGLIYRAFKTVVNILE